jgi:recombination protein RecR
VAALVGRLARLPGIGERTATRLAFHLIERRDDLPERLAEAIQAVRERVRRCSVCGHLTEQDPCRFCASSARETGQICVVEGTADVLAVERTGEYRGRYHVLHGLIRPLDGVGPGDLNLAGLPRRLETEKVEEVILATNPSVEGEATAMYIRRIVQPLGVRVTRIASGLPLGGELEYADRATLGRALAARRDVSGET